MSEMTATHALPASTGLGKMRAAAWAAAAAFAPVAASWFLSLIHI